MNETTEPLFEVMGRASRQLVVKGVKHPVEGVEKVLTQAFQHRLASDRVALTADTRGVTCLVLSPPVEVAHVSDATLSIGLEEVNTLIQRDFQGFPLVRRLVALRASDWPITAAGKTNWHALRQAVSNP